MKGKITLPLNYCPVNPSTDADVDLSVRSGEVRETTLVLGLRTDRASFGFGFGPRPVLRPVLFDGCQPAARRFVNVGVRAVVAFAPLCC